MIEDPKKAVPKFTHVQFPVVRRVFPSLFQNISPYRLLLKKLRKAGLRIKPSPTAEQIVSVQPMSLPSGLLFYLDYTYGKDSQKKEDVENAVCSDDCGNGQEPSDREGQPVAEVGSPRGLEEVPGDNDR